MFCEQHQISRKTFYVIHARTRTDGDKITVADLDGEILIEHTPPPPRGDLRRQPPTPRPAPQDLTNVTDVLRHHTCR